MLKHDSSKNNNADLLATNSKIVKSLTLQTHSSKTKNERCRQISSVTSAQTEQQPARKNKRLLLRATNWTKNSALVVKTRNLKAAPYKHPKRPRNSTIWTTPLKMWKFDHQNRLNSLIYRQNTQGPIIRSCRLFSGR